jgi:peptide/nickel transport system permease protein
MKVAAPFILLPTAKKSWQLMLAIVWISIFTFIAFFPIPNNVLNAYPDKAYLPPFQMPQNWLGTDQLGRDLFWYLLASAKTAWMLTFPPLVGATIIGLLIGSASAYFAKKPLRIRFTTLLFILFTSISILTLAYIYVKWVVPSPMGATSFWLLAIGVLLLIVCGYLWTRQYLSSKVASRFTMDVPVDDLLQRVMDLWTTFPKLLLLLLLSTLSAPSLWSMGIWILVTYWVLPARLTRAQALKIRNEPFFEAGRALGLPNVRLLLLYLWPSMKGSLITNFCFNASGLLGIGSTLAFIGIGIPADVPSWGKMLALSRYSLESWWLLVFPAILLVGSILSLQTIGAHYSKSR